MAKKFFAAAAFCSLVFSGLCRADDIVVRREPGGKAVFVNLRQSAPAALAGSRHSEVMASRRMKYSSLAREAGGRYGVPVRLVMAVMEVESGFNSAAVSSAGAMGLMQLMPETARDLGIEDPFNQVDNVFGGTRLLGRLLERFDGKVDLALAAYHAGERTVARFNAVPPIQATEDYVKRVLQLYGQEGSRLTIASARTFRTYRGSNGVLYYTNH